MAGTRRKQTSKPRTARKLAGRGKAASGTMWPWYLAAIAVIGGVVAYDNSSALEKYASVPQLAAVTRHIASAQQLQREEARRDVSTSTQPLPRPQERPLRQAALAQPTPVAFVGSVAPVPSVPSGGSARFFYCTDQKNDCVVDGRTFWYGGQQVRLADIDVPRIRQARCDAERERGSQAKGRLRDLLNAGAFTLADAPGAAPAKIVLRDGQSIGVEMIRAGLARRATTQKADWC